MVFFHKASNTLLVTDCVICIPRDPPAIIGVEGLLEAAADEGESPRTDSPENRREVCLLDTGGGLHWCMSALPRFASGV